MTKATDNETLNGLIAKYVPYDHIDSYTKNVFCKEEIMADRLFDIVFNRPSYWGKKLLRLRDCLVRPLKLDSVGSMSDMICDKNKHEIVFGKTDKHLTFHTSLLCGKHSDDRQTISITTLVKYNNALGRIYFFIIRPFHIIIVKSLLRRIKYEITYQKQADLLS